MLAELDTEKGVGLIERVKQGQGKPSIIYIRKFYGSTEVKTSEKPNSGIRKSRSQDLEKNDSIILILIKLIVIISTPSPLLILNQLALVLIIMKLKRNEM